MLDEIVFRRIRMEDMVNPFVVNSFYNDCDPDGRTDYVSGPNPQPVDERTPQIKTIRFEDIEAVGAHGCGSFHPRSARKPHQAAVVPEYFPHVLTGCAPG